MPGKSRKHKKDKYYRQNSNAYRDPSRAMMSGDSPSPDSHFELKERLPPAAAAGASISASVSVEPTPGKVVPASEASVAPAQGTATSATADEEVIVAADTPLAPRKDSLGERTMGNGSIDGADNVDKAMKMDSGEEEEEDDCTIKCLYYTMQCCECTLM